MAAFCRVLKAYGCVVVASTGVGGLVGTYEGLSEFRKDARRSHGSPGLPTVMLGLVWYGGGGLVSGSFVGLGFGVCSPALVVAGVPVVAEILMGK